MLEDSRQASVLRRLTACDPGTPLVRRVCDVSVDLLGVSGAGVCVIGGARRQVILHGTDSIAASLEELQLTTAQGPCIEAVRSGSPVMVPELRNFRATAWQDYADRALALGARAVFSFPLQADGARVGALDLYRRHPGGMEPDRVADALAIVHLMTRSILAQRGRLGFDSTVSALHYMTVAVREPAPVEPGGAADLDITVGQALRDPPAGGGM